MGIIRLLLACTVVITHSRMIFGYTFTGGIVAVQSFFIISGFYMALVLNEKYVGKKSYATYLGNRILKLFPAYWFTLTLVVLACFIFYFLHYDSMTLGAYIRNLDVLKLPTLVYLGFINIFMLGQDTHLFLKINPDGLLYWTNNFRDTQLPVNAFVFIPQAWSLGIELLFYLIAPFIVRRSGKTIGILILLSLSLRFLVYYSGFDYDPWKFRFFPFEIMFFLCGALSYKLYKRYLNVFEQKPYLGIIGFAVVVLFSVFYQYIPGTESKEWYFIFVLSCSIPAIFSLTKNMKFDRFIGELSYPVYLTHWLMISIIQHIRFTTPKDTYLGTLACLLSILLSVFIVKYITTPIEFYRQNRVNSFKLYQKQSKKVYST